MLVTKRTPLADMGVKDFKEVINVDLISPFIVSKSVIKGMIDRKSGKIINICSMMRSWAEIPLVLMLRQKAD